MKIKSLIVKPAISWLNTDSDAELINDITVIIMAVGQNVAIYPKPLPDVLTLQTALDNFSAGVAAAADGGSAAKSKKNNLRLMLTGQVRQLASYVQVACGGDMTNLLLSGFPAQKSTRSPIGVLPAPGNPMLVLGSRSGELDASANPVFGASIYNWTLTSNVPGAAAITRQTTASYVTFPGLTPGVIYTMTVNVVGAAGPSNWSQTASQMAV
jgi:hypothetical protein